MSSALASAIRQVQAVRAESLSTLMATLDPVQIAANLGGNRGNSAEASLRAAEAAIKAVLIEALPNGRALLQIAGGVVEAELPSEFLRAASANPDLLKPGTTLTLPANIPARPAPPPATLVAMSGPGTGAAAGASVGPAPPLVNAYPAGTLGAVISRLAGIAFPQGEPAGTGTIPPGSGPAGFRPGILPQQLPPEIAEALLRAASRQMPLAPALTHLLSAATAEPATMPPDLARAIASLQAARTLPDTLGTAEGLRRAVVHSGLFLEANLARATAGTPVPADLKSILLAIRSILGTQETETTETPRQNGAPAHPATRRDGAEAARPSDMARSDMARMSEGALERLKLMQFASMPDHPEITVTDDRAQSMRLAIPIPLATQGLERPQTAIMGLTIEHQPQPQDVTPYEPDSEGHDETEAFPWKVRIALDLEETGPVQAEIGLRGQSVAITLWAERQSMANLARDEIGLLHEALTGAAFEVLKLEVKDGRPLGRMPPSTPLLDRRT